MLPSADSLTSRVCCGRQFCCSSSTIRSSATPGHRDLSKRLGATPPSVSKWLSVLAGSRTCPLAIERIPASAVEPEVRKVTKRNAKRANYYRLNMQWAESVLGSEPLDDIWYDDEGVIPLTSKGT